MYRAICLCLSKEKLHIYLWIDRKLSGRIWSKTLLVVFICNSGKYLGYTHYAMVIYLWMAASILPPPSSFFLLRYFLLLIFPLYWGRSIDSFEINKTFFFSNKEKTLKCSKLSYSDWRVRGDRTVSLLMAVGQIRDCSHSFYWLLELWIILARHHRNLGASSSYLHVGFVDRCP